MSKVKCKVERKVVGSNGRVGKLMRGFFTVKGKHIFVYDKQLDAIDPKLKLLGEIKSFGCPNFYCICLKTTSATRKVADMLVERLYTKMEFNEFIEKLAEAVGLLKLLGRVEHLRRENDE